MGVCVGSEGGGDETRRRRENAGRTVALVEGDDRVALGEVLGVGVAVNVARPKAVPAVVVVDAGA